MLVPAGPGPKPQVIPLQSLVPAGPRLKPQVRPLQSLVPTGFGFQPQSRPLQSLEDSEEELLEILQAYRTTTKRTPLSTHRIPLELFREETLPKCREHCCSTSCKGARENANTTSRSVGLHTLHSFGPNGSKRSRRTHVPATIHPKEKQNLWVPGSSFQVPDPSFWVSGSGFQLPSFGSQLLDMTTRKAGADELSVNPQGYTHQQLPSTFLWQRRFKMRRRVIERRPENAESGSPKGKQRAA
ncbi:hypothetical protein F2Q69_00014503 [Brassica cretica]|uniref:Uncharacterized protein n=1 Tax=Brassica cretica TaxID=69181 RepID=A0A8S9QP68_BRACR|nr:hypothetical protein F2Q69_00014503 [Brassica cretica]